MLVMLAVIIAATWPLTVASKLSVLPYSQVVNGIVLGADSDLPASFVWVSKNGYPIYVDVGCLNKEPLLWPDTGLTVEHFPTSGTALAESIRASLEQLGKTYHEFQDIMDSQVIQHYICIRDSRHPSSRACLVRQCAVDK
ncbi:hypothetical protein VE04_03383 [Pseudogymnoascus sp. 24MN13]|nr:hypothetical protein VE04_03383 [Pseudogymnoascus sp. 24MN13]